MLKTKEIEIIISCDGNHCNSDCNWLDSKQCGFYNIELFSTSKLIIDNSYQGYKWEENIYRDERCIKEFGL